MKFIILTLASLAMLLALACNSPRTADTSYKDNVSKALQQADLQDVTVSEDRDKNTITLGGKVHTDDAKIRAGEVARTSAGNRIVANEISVQPVGVESESKEIASNLDDGIEKNYKAALISSGLDKQSISFNAKNGVLTLSGKVKAPAQRKQAEEVASNIPHVQQVVNQIEIKR